MTVAPSPSQARASRRRGSAPTFAVCAALLGAFWLLASTAAEGKGFTFDEPLHLVAAWTQARTGDFRENPEDPALWRYWTTLAMPPDALRADTASVTWARLPGFVPAGPTFATETLFRTPGTDPARALRAARAAMVVPGVALGVVIAFWAWRLRGGVAAVVATAAFCLDPNFLAHAPLVKNDVAFALALAVTMLCVWSVGRRVTPWNAAAAALACGAALGTKYSGVLVGPIVAAALLARGMLPEPWPVLRRTVRGRAGKLGVALGLTAAFALCAWGVTWATYGLRFGPSPDPGVRLDAAHVARIAARWDAAARHPTTQPTQAEVDAWRPTAVVRLTLWAERHRVLPQTWLVGLLYTYATTRLRFAFLCGQFGSTGWWYYFPLAMAFKTPLATLAAAAAAAGVGAVMLRRRDAAWPALCMAIPAAVVLGTAMAGRIDIGIRHVLAVYPFLYVGVGCAAAAAHARWPRATRGVGAALLVGLAVETLAAYPDYIPFFNAAAGGSRGGFRLLGDSNLDWGQDLPLLARWQREHPGDVLYLDYFGADDPAAYGIGCRNLPGSFAAGPRVDRPDVPGVIAVSATRLQRIVFDPGADPRQRAWYARAPIDVLGGSIYLYRIGPKDVIGAK